MKIKKGDQIIVTMGKDRGRKGKVTHVDAKAGTILVPGINMYKKHEKSAMRNVPVGSLITQNL